MSNMIISLLQTNAVIALIVGAFVTYLAKWLATKDGAKFKVWEGYAITAIKAAEKAIPDDSANISAAKADFALRVFLGRYQAATGVTANPELIAKIESWISVVHNALVESGTLKGSVK